MEHELVLLAVGQNAGFLTHEEIRDYITVLVDQHTESYLGKDLEAVSISACIFTEQFHISSESSKNLDVTSERSTTLE